MTYIKRIDEYHTKMYRNDNYGTIGAPRDPVSVIAFETGELGNTDILDYCLACYGSRMRKETADIIGKAAAEVQDGSIDESGMEEIAKTLVAELERIWRVKIRRVMWLADYDTVADMYCDDGSETKNIKAYETSDYVLCDLGGDGVLFAYPE